MTATLGDLEAALTGDIAKLAEELVGDEPVRTSSRELRFYQGQGLSVAISGAKRGNWYDHGAGIGGGPLKLIMHLRGCDRDAAIAWGRNWVGAAGMTVAQPPCRSQQDRADAQAADRARTDLAQRFCQEAKPIGNTVAETYLVHTRGIPAPAEGWPASIRYHAGTRSLVLSATAADGTVQAVQRVALTAEGQNARDETGRKLKRSHGPQAGAVVRLPAMTDGAGKTAGGKVLLLAEGPETGLSVWRATGHETWITLGSMAKAEPPIGRSVVACADDDPPATDNKRGNAARQLAQAIRSWRKVGCSVVQVTPYPSRDGSGRDFNDLMQSAGIGAVQERIEAVLAQSAGPTRIRVSRAEGSRILVKTTEEFLAVADPWTRPLDNIEAPPPPVHMIKADVGVGKSSAARLAMARTLARMRANGDFRKIAVFVPTNELGDEQARAFEALPVAREHRLAAKVWRGRTAADPEVPGKAMCLDMPAVALAREVGGDPSALVCGGKAADGPKCPFYGVCGYQRQKLAQPDVWLMAHEMLFKKPASELGKFAAVVVDEPFWQAGLQDPFTIPLNLLEGPLSMLNDGDSMLRLSFLRGLLWKALQVLPTRRVPRQALIEAQLSPSNTGEARAAEWRRKLPLAMHPGMPLEERREARDAALLNCNVARLGILWGRVEALVAEGGPEYSGWLTLDWDENGERVIHVSSRAAIAQAWQVPTLILDAILVQELVKPFYPQAELKADILVAAPFQRVMQVRDKTFAKNMYVPFSSKPKDIATTRNNLVKLRAILCGQARRYYPGQVLAVVQKDVRRGLEALGRLPGNLELAHHNASLVSTVGRTCGRWWLWGGPCRRRPTLKPKQRN